MNKKIFLWALYDLANTPLTAAIGGLFLAQWVVLDNHLDDIWYGGTFTLVTVLLLLTSPFWGAWSDKIGKRKPFITWATLILLFVGGITGFVATSSMSPMPRVILVLILFFLLQYTYQVSLISYDALLVKLSKPKTIGLVTGIGEAFDQLGWILGPAMLLPFATGNITVLGEPGRGQVFFPAVLALAIFGLPFVFWFKEPKTKGPSKKTNFRSIYRKTIQGLKFLIGKNRNVAIFLFGFMFVSDALLTANLYFAIYLDQIYKIPDIQKFLILVSMQVVAIPSAYLIGKISDNLGIKKLLILSCIDLIIVFVLLSLFSSLTFVYFLAALMGIGFGGFYTTARAFLVKIAPPSQLGEYFGFYATFQRFASIIGPLTWGTITLLLKNYGVIKYRVAVFALAILMLIGVALLTRVQEKKAV